MTGIEIGARLTGLARSGLWYWRLYRQRSLTMSLAVFGAVVAVSTVHAADDRPLVGDIPMPRIHMPQVDVDIRIGDDVRPLPPPRLYPRGPFAAMPPVRYERELIEQPAVPPYEVARMLQSSGYSLLGAVNRRGWVYTVAVLNPRGDDGRAVIDARTGSIIRFVPAMNVSARFNDELDVVYGPPGPPLHPPPVNAVGQANRRETQRGALLDVQRAPSPVVAVPRAAQQTSPKVASRTAVPVQPTAKPTASAPPVAASAPLKPADNKIVDNKTVGTTTGTAPASPPASATPATAEFKLWPTQAMPEVQPLD